jgi:hypothetical protein
MGAATAPIDVEVAPTSAAAGSVDLGRAPVAGRAATCWPIWQRVLFRFFFVYLLLQIGPWNWFGAIPGVPFLLKYIGQALNWAVYASNDRVFHLWPKLVPVNGSGDTSFAWTQMWLYLTVALVACAAWSVLDRKRLHYDRPLYWLRLIVRYYVATFALSYGIIKLFALQMGFPTLSQLATPLGDLLPMRFSWLFIGYSTPYQVFSGMMETVAGLLLLNRRTITAGIFAALGAFLNVVMINLSYDVPVKLFAMHLLFACIFLLALDSKRVVNFLVLNRTTPPTSAYEPTWTRRWQRWGSAAVKVFIVFQILIFPIKNGWTFYQSLHAAPKAGPFKVGVYDVRSYVVNGASLAATVADTIRWKDVIFDTNGAGSVNTSDQVFWQRYRRGYFRYKPDSNTKTMVVWKTSTIPRDSTFLFTMRYEVPDTNTVRLHTVIRGDSVHVELVRVARHFQLAERQFHWLSEYNR